MAPLMNITHETFNIAARERINGFKHLTVTTMVMRLPSAETVATVKITARTAHESVKLVVVKFQVGRTGIVAAHHPCGRFSEVVMAALGRTLKRTAHAGKAAALRAAMEQMLANTPAWNRAVLLRAIKSMGLKGLKDLDVAGGFNFGRPRVAAGAGLRRSLRIAARRQQARAA
ncbi:hypothetical protein BDY17DRAFT_310731 [Neohortaea acidophila]|uniref:Uncharacterized protein n=1 Tax=Neohortaea acidophila TaxID=245834 RepID=A0A6A6PVT5_9PEZI|nr:uncharacterized protein BDY17DRAFT_310731 [Neohortaea acidophila]KAF2483789.1 hypothetical protein BDY17DRAFT_310731 [Neohortaea acidophila]